MTFFSGWFSRRVMGLVLQRVYHAGKAGRRAAHRGLPVRTAYFSES